MIHKAFLSLKKEDEQAFLKLFPDHNQFKKLMQTVLEGYADTTVKLEIDEKMEKFTEQLYKNEE